MRRPTVEDTRALVLTAERIASRHALAERPALSAQWRRIADGLRRDVARRSAAAA